MSSTYIQYNKKRFIRTLIISSVMFILSFLFVLFPNWFLSDLIQNTIIIMIIGTIGLLFFGLIAIYTGRKVANSKLGLTISDQGILDSSSVFRFGLIEWQDIKGFRFEKIGQTMVVFIDTEQTEKYINRIESPVFRKAAQKNMEVYQTPLFINFHVLKTNQNELENLFNAQMNKSV